MKENNTEILFAKRIMKLMEEAYDIIMNYNTDDYLHRKFEILKDLSSLTVEVLNKEDINKKMREVAESSKVNGDNIDEKFKTFRMIRNVINHFPLFDTWDDIYISNDLLDWNNSGSDTIKNYFKNEKEFSYRIYLNEYDQWVEKKVINIRTPKLCKYNKIYLKDILSLDDALWTFGTIDYYLQFLGLKIETRYLVSI